MGTMNKERRFEAVYQEYYTRVLYHVQKHVATYHEAEDLTQEIFMACYRNFDNFNEEKASVGTWVYVIMKNRLKNYYRDKKDHLSIDDEDNPLNLAGDDLVEQSVLMEEQSRILMVAIGELSEREQIIVKDKYFRKKSANDIAQALGMTAGNVRVTLNRALKKIRENFEKQGYQIG